jgi:hypothetical protein
MRRGPRYDARAVRVWALSSPQYDVEQRVLAAVIVDAAKLAIATDLELDDFFDMGHQRVFMALRNLQAANDDITPRTIAQYLALRDAEKPSRVAEMYLKYLVIVASTLLVRSYEWSFGEAALFVFESDMRLLRMISTQLREASRAG